MRGFINGMMTFMDGGNDGAMMSQQLKELSRGFASPSSSPTSGPTSGPASGPASPSPSPMKSFELPGPAPHGSSLAAASPLASSASASSASLLS